MPDYSSHAARRIKNKLGPFIHDSRVSSPENAVSRGPFELDGDSVYVGQWSADGLREGKGVQMWKDGSKFEGFFKNDMAFGFGRLIHGDGDYYLG